jgi:ABC-type uncharacterized transport system auxiliary subunit
MKNILLIILVLFSSACSFNPVDRGQGRMLMLYPVDQSKPASHSTYMSGHLVVQYPTADAALDSYRVALVNTTGRLDYYSATRWVDFLPLIVQNALVDTLSGAALFETVTSEDTEMRPDYFLKTRISGFEAVYPTDDPATMPEIHVQLDFLLTGRGHDGLQRKFSTTGHQQAKTDTVAGIHDAFKSAFAKAQLQMLSQFYNTTAG